MGSCHRYEYPGYQCYPLKIVLAYSKDVAYTCSGWNLPHTTSVEVKSYNCENCAYVSKESEKSGNTQKDTYWFKLDVPNGTECEKSSSYCKVTFRINPPQREFNNHDGTEPAQKPPYYNWDANNPAMSITARAWRGTENDFDKFTFEPTTNPDPSSDFSYPTDQTYDLVVQVKASGEVSVQFNRVY